MTVHGSWTVDLLVDAHTHHQRRTRGLRPQTLRNRAWLVWMLVRARSWHGSDRSQPSYTGRRGGVHHVVTAPVLPCVDADRAVIIAVLLSVPALRGILRRRARGGSSGRCPLAACDAASFPDRATSRTGARVVRHPHPVRATGLGPVNTIGRFVISLLDGAHRDAVRTHRALPPATAWQCQHAQFAGAQRDPVRRRAGVQVARVAEALWELAHDLHPYESLVQERGARPGLRTPATRPVDPYQAGGGVAGQHRRQGPSRRHGGSKKNGPQAIGKSRGGWTTKIHLVAADARTALTFALSPGQAHDSPEGRKLLASMGPQDDNVALVMDRAYQGDETRQLALDLGWVRLFFVDCYLADS